MARTRTYLVQTYLGEDEDAETRGRQGELGRYPSLKEARGAVREHLGVSSLRGRRWHPPEPDDDRETAALEAYHCCSAVPSTAKLCAGCTGGGVEIVVLESEDRQ